MNRTVTGKPRSRSSRSAHLLRFAAVACVLTSAANPVGASGTKQSIGPPDGASELFGTAMAVEGSRAIIGAPFGRKDRPWLGAAHLYERGNAWTHIHTLQTDLSSDISGFGSAVAISGDIVVVGADGAQDPSRPHGAVGVFTRDGSRWDLDQWLTHGDKDVFAGLAVAVDGDTVVLGFPNAGPSGAVSVYRREAGSWSKGAELTSPLGLAGDRFGAAVSVRGGRMIVGAPGNEGAVHVFQETTGWILAQTLTGPSNRAFGSAVAQSDRHLAIGAPGSGPHDLGAAFAYQRVGPSGSGGLWSSAGTLTQPHGRAGDRFGAAVVVGSDAQISVGSPGWLSGRALLFTPRIQFDDTSADAPVHSVVADWAGEGTFGSSLAMGDDVVLVAAPLHRCGVGRGCVSSQPLCAGSGPVSDAVHDQIAPAAGSQHPDLGDSVHAANCTGVRRVDSARLPPD